MPREGRDRNQRRERRSKSRSRERQRDRGARSEREERDGGRERDRERNRSRSPHKRRSRERDIRSRDRRSRSKSHERSKDKKEDKSSFHRPEVDVKELEGKTEEEIEMLTTMGFCGFDSTHGKHVDGNDLYVANIQKKRKYRQYMNRRGGFNRPLDHVN